jgi:hypothetical protein
MPEWVLRWLLTGEEPGEHDSGYDQFFGFRFCGEPLPILGRLVTEEDSARIDALRKEIRRAHKTHPTRATAQPHARRA